jgi:3-oxoacyl-[acyl-carrier-protein] synthase II
MIVTGAGSVVLSQGEATCDPAPFLKVKKSRKFMGTQDDLAVVACGRALASASLAPPLGERVGLFLAVGYIPFREEDIGPVLAASMTEDGERFDVRRFGNGGFQKAHPLLTFRCLPNMPAYHVSVSFDVQGPYCVTYPGPSQLYAALEEARAALSDRRIDVALVGAVAHQSNFLVRHHFARIEPSTPADRLRDAAAVVVLENEPHAAARGARVRARLEDLRVAYAPHDGLREGRPSIERIDDVPMSEELGPAMMAHALATAIEAGRTGVLVHSLDGRDGVSARSTWRLA